MFLQKFNDSNCSALFGSDVNRYYLFGFAHEFVVNVEEISWRRLGSSDVFLFLKLFVEFLGCHVDAFAQELVSYLNAHWHNFQLNLSCQLWRYTRSTVSYNGYPLQFFTAFSTDSFTVCYYSLCRAFIWLFTDLDTGTLI